MVLPLIPAATLCERLWMLEGDLCCRHGTLPIWTHTLLTTMLWTCATVQGAFLLVPPGGVQHSVCVAEFRYTEALRRIGPASARAIGN